MKILLAVDGSPMSTRAGGARSFHLQRTQDGFGNAARRQQGAVELQFKFDHVDPLPGDGVADACPGSWPRPLQLQP